METSSPLFKGATRPACIGGVPPPGICAQYRRHFAFGNLDLDSFDFDYAYHAFLFEDRRRQR